MAWVSIDEEFSKCKRELGGMKDRVAWLEEDKKLILEKSDEREDKAQEMYRKLLEDSEAMRRENRDLSARNIESELARRKAERELESCKKKNEEFSLRVIRLEQEYELLVKQLLQKSKVDEGKDSTNGTSVLDSLFVTKSANPSKPQVNEVISDGKEKRSSSVGVGCVNDSVNWLKQGADADTDILIRPCNESISIPNQKVVGRGGSSQRDSQKEKRQKIGTVDRKTESEVIVIGDSDTEETESSGRTDSDYDSDDDSSGPVAIYRMIAWQNASKA